MMSGMAWANLMMAKALSRGETNVPVLRGDVAKSIQRDIPERITL
jgi:hypothetical protein